MYNCYISITSIEASNNVYSMHYLIIHYGQDIIILKVMPYTCIIS